MAEAIVHERVQVRRVRDDVVAVVGWEVAVAHAAQVGAITSNPAAASGSMLRHQMRFVSG